MILRKYFRYGVTTSIPCKHILFSFVNMFKRIVLIHFFVNGGTINTYRGKPCVALRVSYVTVYPLCKTHILLSPDPCSTIQTYIQRTVCSIVSTAVQVVSLTHTTIRVKACLVVFYKCSVLSYTYGKPYFITSFVQHCLELV